MRIRGFTVAAAALVLAAALRAETREPSTLTLGWMTEHAAAAVTGRITVLPAPREGRVREADLRVEEVLRGAAEAGATVRLRWESPAGDPPWTDGAAHLVFLPAARPAIVDAFAVKPLPAEGPEARFPAVVRAHAACLGEGAAVARPEALREHLVALLEEEDPGLAWSGATDLVRHGPLHEGLTGDQRRRVLASFRRRPAGKMDKPALALAVAAARPPGAAAALVEALGIPGARAIRPTLGESLRRLGDPATSTLLESAYRSAPTGTKADLLRAAGLAGLPTAVPMARAALGEGSAELRAEGAQALGLLAREIRRADPEAALPASADLERVAVRGEGFADDHRAALWALAQVEAWAPLRRIAAEDPRPEARAFAERCLKAPRRALILAGSE